MTTNAGDMRGEVRDVVVEAVNARDFALVREHLGDDAAERLREPLLRVRERWPRLIMSRGDLKGDPVAAVWLPGRRETYVQVGHVEFAKDNADGPRLELFPGVHKDLVAKQPGPNVAEWESMEQLDSGGDDWI